MSDKRVLLGVLMASALVLAGVVGWGVVGRSQAAPPGQSPDAGEMTVPYAGQLSDTQGEPVADGAYDLTFALYATQTGGQALWQETQTGVPVEGGSFRVQLGSGKAIPEEALATDGGWLAVAVRGAGEEDFTTLAPRQRLNATELAGSEVSAAAGPTCPHDHWGETWVGSGSEGLNVRSTSIGVMGANSATANWGYLGGEKYGVRAAGVCADCDGVFGYAVQGSGVKGESTSGVGVEAVSWSGNGVDADSVSGSGVEAVSTSGTGVEAASTSGHAVRGLNSAEVRAAVYGKNSSTGAGVEGLSLNGHGVYGETGGEHAWRSGVYGTASKDNANGVTGWNTGNGVGVYAYGEGGAGVWAVSKTGRVLVVKGDSGDLIQAWDSSPNPDERRFLVTNAGEVYADGAFHPGGADLAEMLPAVEGLEPGDVLVVGADGKLTRSTTAFQPTVVGVYSTDPGFVGGYREDADQTGAIPLAVIGVVPVKASVENGSIAPGDLLVAASVPGHAMRGGPNPPQGTVIGKALEGLDAGQDTGVIQALVTLQ